MTLQQALDNWATIAPQLQEIYQQLNAGHGNNTFAFEPQHCAAPLPRAYQWVDGSAYVYHVELVRKARGAELPKEFWTSPVDVPRRF